MHYKVKPGTTVIENGAYIYKELSLEDTEIIEEVIVIRRRVPKRNTDMDGNCTIQPFAKEACAFDNWDWIKHPVANMYCGCSKCSPRCY